MGAWILYYLIHASGANMLNKYKSGISDKKVAVLLF